MTLRPTKRSTVESSSLLSASIGPVGDFFQNGPITTLQDLTDRSYESLAERLRRWRKNSPMSLVIPALYSELSRPALANIVKELEQVDFLDQIIIGLDRADASEFAEAKRFFASLGPRTQILWNDGPRLREIDERLAEASIAPEFPGKGRNVWYCFGYFMASGVGTVVGMHDADVITYDRSMVARLFYPVVHPTFGYAFSKGYYFRSDGEKMNGRVVRILVTPLIRALKTVIGPLPYLEYLDSFRYPLAGECAMHKNVVRNMRIPSDWGLEIGMLSEVHRRYTDQRICQVDLAGPYDHKHQVVSAEDAETGLHKMSLDISKALFRKLAIGGTVFSMELFRTIKAAYYRLALDQVERYSHLADMNGLQYDTHNEEKMVELFAQTIMDAGEDYLLNPMESPFISSWARVRSAIPDIFDSLATSVAADNELEAVTKNR